MGSCIVDWILALVAKAPVDLKSNAYFENISFREGSSACLLVILLKLEQLCVGVRSFVFEYLWESATNTTVIVFFITMSQERTVAQVFLTDLTGWAAKPSSLRSSCLLI